MRTAYDAWRDHDRYEDMSGFDQMIVDEYEADKAQERADSYEDDRERREDEYDD